MIAPDAPQPKIEDLAWLSTADLVKRFSVGVEHFDKRSLKLDDRQLDTAFRPEAGVGNWPVRVLLGHLADAELSFTQRMRRIIAEDAPTLEAWDENAFIDNHLYGKPDGPKLPIAPYIATIFTLRKWMGEFLLTQPESAFRRKGLHSVRGEMTMRTVLEYDTWHLEHHAWFLNRKVAKLAMPGM
jgi:hypothetical protein